MGGYILRCPALPHTLLSSNRHQRHNHIICGRCDLTVDRLIGQSAHRRSHHAQNRCQMAMIIAWIEQTSGHHRVSTTSTGYRVHMRPEYIVLRLLFVCSKAALWIHMPIWRATSCWLTTHSSNTSRNVFHFISEFYCPSNSFLLISFGFHHMFWCVDWRQNAW